MQIAVIGTGYVGLVAGACFAEIGHQVFLVENDTAKLSALQRGEVPIHEQHLPELLSRVRGDRLSFTSNIAEAVRDSQAVFITVGTPPMANGGADLSYVDAVAREIAEALTENRDYKIVVEKSTVPVYTSEWVRKVMLLNGAGRANFDVASNPEFLREGTAVTDFLYPDRIVIGADAERCANVLREIYQPLTDGSYYLRPNGIVIPDGNLLKAPLIVTSSKSAELIKHASNAFLAMKISFINAVASICESVGADVEQVRHGIGTDTRIGMQFLNPGIGYGGSCFPKDISAFHKIASDCGYDFGLLREVMRINNDQRDRFISKVRSILWTLKGKRLGVLGLSFKEGTDDIRESPAISIVSSLVDEGCSVSAYDPAAAARAKEILSPRAVRFVDSAYDAADRADALLVLTAWSEFKTLDLTRLRRTLRYPIIIDGRNLYEPQEMERSGFIYISVGRGKTVPAELDVIAS